MIGTSNFIIALLLILVVMAVIGEPYSTWLAFVLILGALYYDAKKNGSSDLISTLFKAPPSTSQAII